MQNRRLQSIVIIFFAALLAPTASGQGAAYFWSSKTACIERQLQVERIREGLKAAFIELRLAEIGHDTAKSDPEWKPLEAIQETTFEGIDHYIRDIRIVCRLRYPN